MVCSGSLKAGVWEPCPSIFKPHTKGDQEGSGKRALAEPLLSRSRPLPSQLRKYYLPPACEGSAQAYKTSSFQACKKPSSSSCVPHRPSKKEGITRALIWELEPQLTAAWVTCSEPRGIEVEPRVGTFWSQTSA